MSSTMYKTLFAILAASASAMPTSAGSSSSPSPTMYSVPKVTDFIPGFTATNTGPVPPLDTASQVPSIVASMKTAATNNGRFKALLAPDGKLLEGEELRQRTIFDFNLADKPAEGAKGGAIALANIANFPILTGLGQAVAVGFLGACGLNTPHTHPRATEFLTLVDGEVLETGFILENGFAVDDMGNVGATGTPIETRATIQQFQGTVFPVGSNHWQFNPTCSNATFVAALSNEDPGTSQLAQNFFNLEGNVINATLGFPETIDGKDLWAFKKQIPANVAEIVDRCQQKCGLRRF